jgi:hypothetical protein
LLSRCGSDPSPKVPVCVLYFRNIVKSCFWGPSEAEGPQQAAIKNVREKCNVEITKDNIMSRNKTFDKHHTIINGMLETSGFGWDWNKNKISVDSDSVWEAYVAVSFSFFCFYVVTLSPHYNSKCKQQAIYISVDIYQLSFALCHVFALYAIHFS